MAAKTELVKFRLAEEEKTRFAAGAHADGMTSLSEWFRALARERCDVIEEEDTPTAFVPGYTTT